MSANVQRTEQVTIAASVTSVWEMLADFGSITQWAPNVDHSCLTSDQGEGVGAVRRVQVGRNALLERVIAWEPTKVLGYVIEGLPPMFGAIANTWRLDENGHNSEATIVSLTTSIATGNALPKRLAGKTLIRPLGAASLQMLHGLRQHLEESHE